ncbi:AMP-binding protein [Campylobacter sp.]|uniref:AMP-binding protein n=1 Tax=Campylobacter sp. TaxID=205 RepID=UPI002AA687DB|nr:AMP-binding protein [Campylobacter sp.]MCI6660852.1 AMP-binding protein [Campylobacter sp.]MCI7549272.1 AMP-binding protein [Campylobacter sp.]
MKNIINPSFKIQRANKIYSANELIDFSARFCAGLKKQNVSEVEIYLTSTLDFIVAFFAALSLNIKIYVSQKDENSQYFYINDEKFKEILEFQNEKIEPKIDINSIFFMQTSGSSSVAKKIPKSIKQMLDEAKAIRKFLAVKTSDKFIANIPYQHLFGLTFKVFTPLTSGALIEDEQLVYPEMLITYAKTEKDLILLCTPTALKALVSKEDESLHNISLVITAGSKLTPELKEQSYKVLKNAKLIDIYGSTETGVIASNTGDYLKIFPEVKLSIDEMDRLIINSPWINNNMIKGAFLSSDCAKINGDELILLGRSDRMIKLHEKRFNLDDVESIIRNDELIDDCAAGLEDDKTRFSTLITLSDKGKEVFRQGGKIAVLKNIKETLKTHIGNEIRYFYIRENLPYNERGKIAKKDFLKECKALHKLEPKIIEKSKNSIKASVFINPGCFYFDGHFVSFPVLPGFVQLGVIMDLLGNDFSSYLVENIKFTSIIRPFDSLDIQIELKEKVYFSIKRNETECAKGRIKLCK